MKIFITRNIPEVGLNMLRQAGHELDISQKDAPLSKSELILALQSKPYDAVITLLTDQVDGEVLAAAPKAKIFANYFGKIARLLLLNLVEQCVAIDKMKKPYSMLEL